MTRKVIRSNLPAIVAQHAQKIGYVMTQSQIAQAVGVRQPTISVWMSNNEFQRVDTTVWTALCDYFGVSPEEMLIFEDVPDTESDAPALIRAGAAL